MSPLGYWVWPMVCHYMDVWYMHRYFAEEILRGASERIGQVRGGGVRVYPVCVVACVYGVIQIRSLTAPETDQKYRINRSSKTGDITRTDYCISNDLDPSLLSVEAMAYGFEFNKDAWGRLGGWPYCTCIQLYAGVIGGYMYTV
eukprot:GHVO01009639.1.p1 GENE.GHVO01009639.1~~GHVO01009639.1.p1  ORF type:complete len:144 (+),score=16.79 GHVO01009639.1:482-913(+)